MNSDKFQELVLQQFQALTSEIKALTEGQQALAEGQNTLAGAVKELSEGQQQLSSKVDSLESKVNTIDSKMDNLELRMENEVIDRIRGLFDAREVQNDRFDRIEEKLGSIETDTGYLVNKVARLEHIAK